MSEIINNLWQNNHDLAIIIVNFLISLLMLIINNIYTEYKNSLKALENCEVKIDNFKNSLINAIGNNNKNLIQEHFTNNFQNLQNIYILKKKNEKLYRKFNKLKQIYDNFLNDMYSEKQEEIISEIEKI